MHPNYLYKIKQITNEHFVLQDTTDKTEFKVHHDVICSSFSLPYCNTVHAAQGGSIKEPFVIADYMSSHVTDKWFYTAISRCVELDHVWFLDLNMYPLNVEHECEVMVCGYKHQDKKRGMGTDDVDYIDAAWIMGMYSSSKQCRLCKHHMVFEIKNPHKVTVNRLNNAFPHIMYNCELLCKSCNVQHN